jgi:glutamate transport system substrate-binding protein
MRRTRTLAGIGIAAATLLALTACNSGTPAEPGGDTGDAGAEPSTWFEVATDVQLEGSPTFDKMVEAGKVTIGVKEDQPNLGYLDVTTNERTGFDIDIARWIAASLGFDEEQIEYKPIASANREQAIVNGDIDYYVGTYSITEKRKDQIDFAGPYFISGQGFLVGADSEITDVKEVSDFNGKTVCSATGSTPIQNIKENFPEITTEEYDLYSACVEDLINGKVDAVTTDQAILIGYAAKYPDEVKVVGGLFTEERYGVGLPKGDTVLLDHINALLTDGGDIWQAIFDKNLGSSGIEVEQPAVD